MFEQRLWIRINLSSCLCSSEHGPDQGLFAIPLARGSVEFFLSNWPNSYLLLLRAQNLPLLSCLIRLIEADVLGFMIELLGCRLQGLEANCCTNGVPWLPT